MTDLPSFEALQLWYIQLLTAARPDLDLKSITTLAANATEVALDYAKAHPYSTTISVISIGLTPVLGSGWMLSPLLRLVGFTPLGPAAGKADSST